MKTALVALDDLAPPHFRKLPLILLYDRVPPFLGFLPRRRIAHIHWVI